MKKEIRIENTHIIRYAGDEFIVLFDQCSIALNEIEALMEDAQIKLSQLKLKSKAIKEKLSFTFSFGAISFKAGEEFHNAIEIADERMYENKKKVKGL